MRAGHREMEGGEGAGSGGLGFEARGTTNARRQNRRPAHTGAHKELARRGIVCHRLARIQVSDPHAVSDQPVWVSFRRRDLFAHFAVQDPVLLPQEVVLLGQVFAAKLLDRGNQGCGGVTDTGFHSPQDDRKIREIHRIRILTTG